MFPIRNRCCSDSDGKVLAAHSQQESKLSADPPAIWIRIREALQLKTAPEIARKLGLSKQSVYEWQRSVPGLDSLIAIAESGNVSLHWLITGQGPKKVGDAGAINLTDVERKIIQKVADESGTKFDETLHKLLREALFKRGSELLANFYDLSREGISELQLLVGLIVEEENRTAFSSQASSRVVNS